MKRRRLAVVEPLLARMATDAVMLTCGWLSLSDLWNLAQCNHFAQETVEDYLRKDLHHAIFQPNESLAVLRMVAHCSRVVRILVLEQIGEETPAQVVLQKLINNNRGTLQSVKLAPAWHPLMYLFDQCPSLIHLRAGYPPYHVGQLTKPVFQTLPTNLRRLDIRATGHTLAAVSTMGPRLTKLTLYFRRIHSDTVWNNWPQCLVPLQGLQSLKLDFAEHYEPDEFILPGHELVWSFPALTHFEICARRIPISPWRWRWPQLDLPLLQSFKCLESSCLPLEVFTQLLRTSPVLSEVDVSRLQGLSLKSLKEAFSAGYGTQLRDISFRSCRYSAFPLTSLLRLEVLESLHLDTTVISLTELFSLLHHSTSLTSLTLARTHVRVPTVPGAALIFPTACVLEHLSLELRDSSLIPEGALLSLLLPHCPALRSLEICQQTSLCAIMGSGPNRLTSIELYHPGRTELGNDFKLLYVFIPQLYQFCPLLQTLSIWIESLVSIQDWITIFTLSCPVQPDKFHFAPSQDGTCIDAVFHRSAS